MIEILVSSYNIEEIVYALTSKRDNLTETHKKIIDDCYSILRKLYPGYETNTRNVISLLSKNIIIEYLKKSPIEDTKITLEKILRKMISSEITSNYIKNNIINISDLIIEAMANNNLSISSNLYFDVTKYQYDNYQFKGKIEDAIEDAIVLLNLSFLMENIAENMDDSDKIVETLNTTMYDILSKISEEEKRLKFNKDKLPYNHYYITILNRYLDFDLSKYTEDTYKKIKQDYKYRPDIFRILYYKLYGKKSGESKKDGLLYDIINRIDNQSYKDESNEKLKKIRRKEEQLDLLNTLFKEELKEYIKEEMETNSIDKESYVACTMEILAALGKTNYLELTKEELKKSIRENILSIKFLNIAKKSKNNKFSYREKKGNGKKGNIYQNNSSVPSAILSSYLLHNSEIKSTNDVIISKDNNKNYNGYRAYTFKRKNMRYLDFYIDLKDYPSLAQSEYFNGKRIINLKEHAESVQKNYSDANNEMVIFEDIYLDLEDTLNPKFRKKAAATYVMPLPFYEILISRAKISREDMKKIMKKYGEEYKKQYNKKERNEEEDPSKYFFCCNHDNILSDNYINNPDIPHPEGNITFTFEKWRKIITECLSYTEGNKKETVEKAMAKSSENTHIVMRILSK